MSDWIDVTRTLTGGMIHWPGDPPFHLRRIAEVTGPGAANLSEISTCVHAGTHVDAPFHFIPDGADVAELPLAKLCGPAIVVDLPQAREVAVEDLESAGIEPGVRVLLRTVNQVLWDEPEFNENFLGMTGDAAMWLVDRDVPVLGVDYLSVDRYRDSEKPAHHALLGNGVIIIEGLDLSQVAPGGYEMVALPLKIAGSEASPARVIVRPLKR